MDGNFNFDQGYNGELQQNWVKYEQQSKELEESQDIILEERINNTSVESVDEEMKKPAEEEMEKDPSSSNAYKSTKPR